MDQKSLQRNFTHLYWDIAWFGVLNGSTLSFLNIYAARLKATGFEIGIIGAIPAFINLLLTLPAGQLLNKFSITKAVIFTAFTSRIFYLFFIALPWLFDSQNQILFICIFLFLMSIPNTILAVGFSVLFSESVPNEWRSKVAGIRNALLSIITMGISILCGYILFSFTFPTGYQIVFALGFIGSYLSCTNLLWVKPIQQEPQTIFIDPSTQNLLEYGNDENKPKRYQIVKYIKALLSISGSYKKIILLLFIFHLFQYLAMPIFPLYSVNNLALSDRTISVGNGLFYLFVCIGSLIISRFISKYGNHKVTAIGVIFLGFYPALIALSKFWIILYFLASLIGGFAWAMVSVALLNYLLEKVPINNKANYLAWYNLALNAAILFGSIFGPGIGAIIGYIPALIIFACGRIMAGIAILRWG